MLFRDQSLALAIAFSSHNEYMAAFHAAKESKWIRDLLMELDLPGNDWSKPVIVNGADWAAWRPRYI